MTRPIAPPAVRWITRKLEDAGHETWTVGGAVRDACLGHPSDEWDLATHARPEEVRRIFRRTVPLGIEHGTVGVLSKGTMYEVTTFRRDVETDGRHAVVSFAETLEEDLGRRDFTINAIAWHALREELRDPFGGEADLGRGVLRTVGEARERFREDYLRILRALRFAGRFGLRVDDATWDALAALVDHLRSLSAERIRDELLKVLSADAAPGTALDLYAKSGALAVLYPELEARRRRSAMTPTTDAVEGGAATAWGVAVEAAGQLPVGQPLLRLAALLDGVEPEAAAALLLRIRLSNAQIDRVARLVGAGPLPLPDAPDHAFRRWLSQNGPDVLTGAARVQLAHARAGLALMGDGLGPRPREVAASWLRARSVRAGAPPLSVGDLALDGRGLISLGLRPGPDFGSILADLLDWVLEEPGRNDAARLRERVLERVGEDRLG